MAALGPVETTMAEMGVEADLLKMDGDAATIPHVKSALELAKALVEVLQTAGTVLQVDQEPLAKVVIALTVPLPVAVAAAGMAAAAAVAAAAAAAALLMPTHN